MSESLKQKAKTLMQDLKTIFKTSGLGTRNLLFKDVFEYCRNMSTDAQQEIDEHGKNNEALAKVCSNLNDKIERLERERGLQKQKLQQFPKLPKDPNTADRINHSIECLEWLEQFKELLK